MNTLYPGDPDGPFKTNNEAGKIVDAPTLTPAGPAGGTVAARIGTNNLGVTNHTRRMLTTFDPAAGAAGAVVLADTSDDGKVWQMVTLAPNTITTGGNTFTVTSPEGHTLKGTVLYPKTVTFKTGTRARGSKAADIDKNNFVHFSSDDGSYLVVLTLQPKGAAHPAVSATGTWGPAPSGTVTIGKFTATVDGDKISGK
jgi:hypothetical protein